MKICIINSVYGVGSTGRIVKEIADSVNLTLDECHIIYSRNNTDSNQYVHRIYDTVGFFWHALNGVVFDRHGLYSRRNTKRIIKLLDKIHPDIVNLHNLHGFYVNYVTLFDYLRDKKIKIVYTLHDCWSFTGFCSHYTRSGCDQWRYGCKKCRYRNIYPYRVLSHAKKNFELKKRSYSNQNIVVVTPSRWLANQVRLSMWNDVPLSVIPNDVDYSVFHPYDFEKKQEIKLELGISRKIVLAVASIWTNAKGLDDIIRLSHLLSNDYVIVLVGKSHKKDRNIIHFESVCKEKLADLYNVADCFINCTYEDTYPTVNLEALACGCPVITYETGGSTELCNDLNNVIKTGAVEVMSNLINTNNFSRRVNCKRNSLMADSYLKLFKCLYDEKPLGNLGDTYEY